jgi:phage terminase large subunit-like protein
MTATLEQLQDISAYLEYKEAYPAEFIELYDWQRRFVKATKTNRQCLLMAANRVGKTYTGNYIDSVHLTGDYPDDWEGYKFTFPPLVWCLGYSGEKCRDLIQNDLFGQLSQGEFTGGLVPKDRIGDAIPSGIPRLAQQVKVKWISPEGVEGWSRVQFKSYSQGQHALMGDSIEWYHIDEEPKDATIWPQILTRTASGDRGKGGRGIQTFTPENGKTEIVAKFMDDPGPGQYMQTATWDDAPHLTEEIKEELLGSYPAYQRDMRTRGTPLMGAGLIFEHSKESISCPRMEIPDHWWLLNGMDFGWDHPQAHIQIAIDPDNGITYITNAYKKSKIQPHDAWHVVSSWSEGVPVAWPQDGLQTRENGKEKRDFYIESGFDMCDDHATWEGGGVGVELGLMAMNKEFSLGTLKVFSDLHEVFEELREYHRKSMPNGVSQIVKLKDDLIDAIRYAIMMRRFAIQKSSLTEEDEYYDDHRETNAGGY